MDFDFDLFREVSYVKAHLKVAILECNEVVRSPSLLNHLRMLYNSIQSYDFYTPSEVEGESADESS